MIDEVASTARKPVRYLLSMGVYNAGLNLMLISFSSILLPIMVQNATSESTKGLWLGIVAMVSIFVGVTVNIVAAVVSDHSRSKWGRRTPNILLGMICTVVTVVAWAFLPQSLPVIFAGYLLLQAFVNVSVGSYQPLLADIVPENQRGMTSGFQGMFTILGAAVGFVAITALVSSGKVPLALLIVGGAFLVTTLLTGAVIRRDDRPLRGAEPLSVGKALRETFRVRTRVPGFFWFVFANCLMYIGISSFSSYGIYYFQTVLEMPDPVRAMGTAGLVGISVNVVMAVAAGIASDRVGRKPLILLAGVTSGALSLIFPWLRSFTPFLLVSAVYGAANGVVYSVNQALASSLVPAAEAGKYMGYNNLSMGVANAVAPMIFGAILNMRGAPTRASFTVFYVVAAAFYFVSSGLIALKVPKK